MGQKISPNCKNTLRLRGSCAVLGLAAGLVLLAAQSPACAGDENDANNFYNKTFGRFLEGIGFQKADGGDDINYTERPPLVLPPNRELPPPDKGDKALSAAWPKDPDVKRRKLIEQQEKNRIISDERERDQNPLRPEQLTPGPRPRGVAAASAPQPDNPSGFTKLLSPSELGYKGGMFSTMFHGKDNDVAQFTGEPPRHELTEPPPGYQTPSPQQPYGVTGAPAKAEDNYLHRSEPVR